jgi:hypothetical protein
MNHSVELIGDPAPGSSDSYAPTRVGTQLQWHVRTFLGFRTPDSQWAPRRLNKKFGFQFHGTSPQKFHRAPASPVFVPRESVTTCDFSRIARACRASFCAMMATPIFGSYAAFTNGKVADRLSKSRTSSSLTCEKFLYHCPTARNGSGVTAQTT